MKKENKMNQSTGFLPRKLLLCEALLCTLAFLLCFHSAFAAPTASIPAVSFSPEVIDFGQIPSSEHPTQLLTIRFNRRVFPPDHLPSLRTEANYDLKLTLFSRVDDPKTITVIYRVTLPRYVLMSRFLLHLTLHRDPLVSKEDDATVAVEDNGVIVKGEIVQGLDTDTPALDFGNVMPGNGATKEFRVGVYGPNMMSREEMKSRTAMRSPALWEMSVTSSSPYITAPFHREMGLNGSSWVTWRIVLSPKTPANFGQAELVFHTANGYSLTVPVYADVRDLAAVQGFTTLEPLPTAKH